MIVAATFPSWVRSVQLPPDETFRVETSILCTTYAA